MSIYTPEQKAIITHENGHALVMAVAGSGKTTAMIAHLIVLIVRENQRGNTVDPLVLMFNNKAQDEFVERLSPQCESYSVPTPEVRTFHSFGLKLTDQMVEFGLLPSARLSTKPWELESMAKTALTEAASKLLPDKRDRLQSKEMINDFVNFIDLVKSDIVKPAEKFEALKLPPDLHIFCHAFDLFEKRRKSKKMRFFSDLIYDPVMLMLRQHKVIEWAANRYSHIIIDEYQDINEIQQQLVRIIAGDRAQVMVVGDADQCIYEWRGAKPGYITHLFEEDFPGATRYSLSYTFRYGHALALAADHMIRNNLDRNNQICVSHENTPDTRVQMHATRDFDNTVSSLIKAWTDKGGKWSEIAVLVRLYAMSPAIELDLLYHEIPFRVMGRDGVLSRDELDGLVGFVRLAQGNLFNDAELLKMDDYQQTQRIYHMLNISYMGISHQLNIELCERIKDNPASAVRYLQELAKSTTGRTQQVLIDRASLWQMIEQKGSAMNPKQIMQGAFVGQDAEEYYRKIYLRFDQAEERVRFCQSLINIAELYPDNTAFLKFIDTCQHNNLKASARGRRKTNQAEECVTIMSIHKAKGKEWPMVVVPGLKEGDFPFYTDPFPPVEVEDERRLCYVAMTRAEKELHLLHPVDEDFMLASRQGNTSIENIKPGGASRFLYEANIHFSNEVNEAILSGKQRKLRTTNGYFAEEYLKLIGSSLKVQSIVQEKEIKKTYTRPRGFQRGDRVLHNVFGEGVVVSVLPVEADGKGAISIQFDRESETREFILRNIDLRRIESTEAASG